MAKRQLDKLEAEVVNLFTREIVAWEQGRVWVSRRVAFDMREVMDRSIKNFYGAYDEPNDKITGRKKFWVPLTEWTTESIVKNIDLDQRDIMVRAQKPSRYGSAAVIRYLLNHTLRRIEFGDKLNELLRFVAITGTAIAKVQKGKDPVTGKQTVLINPIHPLNFIIDPSARSIQEAPACYERNVVSIKEAHDMPWGNAQKIEGRANVERVRYGTSSLGSNQSFNVDTIPMVEVYERWGLFPSRWITGKDEDKKWINGVVIVTDLFSNPYIQVIKETKNKWKPYEEARFKRVPGRFHGRGVGEMLMSVQESTNELVNTRSAANRIRSMGLYQGRKGAGITPEMVQQLFASSAIITPRADDLRPLSIPDMPATAYKDEENNYLYAERTTGTSRLEDTNASQPATTSVLQSQSSRSAYAMAQETFGFFLERLIERHVIPNMLNTYSVDDVVNITGEPKDLRELDEALVGNFINKSVVEYWETNGVYPSGDEVVRARERAETKLRKQKDNRWIQIHKDVFDPEFSVDVYITPEIIDRSIMVQQLTQLAQTFAPIPGLNLSLEKIGKEALDLMGLGGDRFVSDEPTPGVPVPQTAPPRPETPGGQAANALTPEMAGAASTPSL